MPAERSLLSRMAHGSKPSSPIRYWLLTSGSSSSELPLGKLTAVGSTTSGDSEPQWARFQYHAHFAVTKGPFAAELESRNQARNAMLKEWMVLPGRGDQLSQVPAELLPSLIIGQADSYCRAWLAGRSASSPRVYRETLAEAAWRSVGGA